MIDFEVHKFEIFISTEFKNKAVSRKFDAILTYLLFLVLDPVSN